LQNRDRVWGEKAERNGGGKIGPHEREKENFAS